jgi:hypothetical protein
VAVVAERDAALKAGKESDATARVAGQRAERSAAAEAAAAAAEVLARKAAEKAQAEQEKAEMRAKAAGVNGSRLPRPSLFPRTNERAVCCTVRSALVALLADCMRVSYNQ